MAKKKTYINWSNCIHIHACRRFSKIVERKTGKYISRGCGKDCEAYEENDILIDEACEWLESNADAYANAQYIPEIDYLPNAWVNIESLLDDFKEYIQNNK